MSHARLWIVGAAALLLIVLVGGKLLRPDHKQRNFEFMPDMAYSPAYASLTPNPNFPDGMTQRRPVAGTVAQGYPPLHYQATPADAARAGEELTNPFGAGDSLALSRGAVVYATFCQVCHGPTGAGDGIVARRGYPPPPSLTAEHARTIKDGQIFHILTYGQNNMPSYVSQVMRDDRWKVILYVRQLQQNAAPASAAPGTLPAPQASATAK